MSIKHDHTLNPVTALEFFTCPAGRQLVLAGEGCYLKIFEAQTSNLLSQFQVFTDQTIHGIAVRNDARVKTDLQIVIWGGSSLTLLRKAQIENLLSQDLRSIVNLATLTTDWILDIAISPYDTTSCVLVTAHNTVGQAKLVGISTEVSLETLHSPSRSILYSAHLVWESADSVLVAAGTVFGEIITWDCSLSVTGSSRVLATFSGHEGSIFGVHISPPTLDSNGAATRLLASCSDDRTIRIWDIYGSAKVADRTDGAQPLDLEAPRETGFGNNEQAVGNQNPVETCLAMVMGHASRIWRVKFHISKTEALKLSKMHVLSFGEDSTAQQWELNNDASEETDPTARNTGHLGTLRHLHTFAFHSGKHIWSTAMSPIGDPRNLLVTGGADGKIAFYEAPSKHSKNNEIQPDFKELGNTTSSSAAADELLVEPPTSCAWELDDILRTLPDVSPRDQLLEQPPPGSIEDIPVPDLVDGKPPKKSKPKKIPKDAFNRYTFVSESEILLTTTFGRVVLGHLHGSTSWDEIQLPDSGKMDLKSYSVIKGVPNTGLALLGGANGNIYLYQKSRNIEKVAQVEGKVADIFPLSHAKGTILEIIVTTLGTDTATFISLDLKDPATSMRSVSLQLPNKFVVTSVEKTSKGLIMGSRNGSLSIFDTRAASSPIATWASNDSTPGDAITSITALQDFAHNLISYFITTGRDGTYSVFASEISEDGSFTKVYLVHKGTPPLGPNIESAWFEDSDLVLYGFKSKSFILWNESKQSKIMNVECGGAHRSYAYSPLADGGGYFIYTKASKLYLHSQRTPSHKIIKPGGHGREIKACAVSSNHTLIATGAEDTAIRIWRYHDSPSPLEKKFESQAVIQKHSAGIQALRFYESRYLFSSGGNEEFFVWALHEIPGFGVGVVCEAACPDQSEERDLRIMGFDVSPPGGNNSEELLISLAYSDSTIRCYRYSKASSFKLVANGRYTSSCLMQIRHIQVSSEEIHLLTAATDGNLVIWKASLPDSLALGAGYSSQQLLRLTTHRLHQSTVKCLDFVESISKKHIVVATGGDDNAIGITIYSSTNLNVKPKSIILRSAHAAAVTGLTCVPSNSEDVDEVRVVSSSNDQRIKEWVVSIGADSEMAIRKAGDAFTSVADVGDVAVLRDGILSPEGEEGRKKKVLVVGNGMEVFSVSEEH